MRIAFLLPVLALAVPLAPAAAPDPGATPAIAHVNGRAIGLAQYEQALVAAVRQRYYHRAPPEGEMAGVRREVADALIDLALSSAEAQRRGIRPDAAAVERDLARIEARFSSLPDWPRLRESQLATWRADLEERSIAEALERQVRAAVATPPEQVRRFYDDNPSLFTEPEKVRIGVILLKVDPSAGKAARERAREEAAAIRARLAKGADFAELAGIHSGDESASRGGDLGFVHRGALPEPVQAVADKLDGGAMSEPIDVLEGVAIIRVSGRAAAALRPFDAVEERARELLRRKSADEAWKAFVAKLRTGAKIEVDAQRVPELAAAPKAGEAVPPPR